MIGDIQPIDTVEVEKVIKENLLKLYPLSATELANHVSKRVSGIGKNAVWAAIKENGLRGDEDYSAYNFRNKRQQDNYEKTGKVPASLPVLYNSAAVELLVKTLSK